MTEHEVTLILEENQRLRQRIEQLERELAKARKNSSSSSKPPSSDIVKPPKQSKQTTTSGSRKAGGQPGPPKHERAAFPPEPLDHTHEYTLETCPCCGTALEAAEKAPQIIQQIEIVEIPVCIEEHRGYAYWYPIAVRYIMRRSRLRWSMAGCMGAN